MSFEIFTTVPRWFFDESLSGPFAYHEVKTDVGLVQKDPLRADLKKTVASLREFLPFDPVWIESLAGKVNRLGCAAVICDISPLGIVVAKKAGLPSVLVENFTWDWVYGEYASEYPGFRPYMEYVDSLFLSVDFHIQASPVCSKKRVQLTTGPISRSSRSHRKEVRNRLGISHQNKMVLITMGGIPKQHPFMEQLRRQKNVFFVAPGAGTRYRTWGNVIFLPHHSDFFHPDLVGAADAVVGKVGYSTLSEVYHAGVPFGYIKRARFQESDILSAYIERYMSGFAIDEKDFENGNWVFMISELLALPPVRGQEENGAVTAAGFVLECLKGPAK